MFCTCIFSSLGYQPDCLLAAVTWRKHSVLTYNYEESDELRAKVYISMSVNRQADAYIKNTAQWSVLLKLTLRTIII